jgi:uncharacterized protein (TIGR02147 family)
MIPTNIKKKFMLNNSVREPKPSVFEFVSLESYLTRHFQYRKLNNPQFSYQVWAKRLSIRASSILCMVVKGNRPPSLELRDKLKTEMGLDHREARYFDLLVEVKKNGGDVTRTLQLMKELEETHPQKGFRLIEQDQFRAISNWYHYALLELIECRHFIEDPALLSQSFEFQVSELELKEAIATLLRLGLLARNKKGKLFRVPGPLITHSDQSDEGLRIYHEQTLQNARQAIRSQNSSEREINGLTLCLKAAKIPEAKKKLRSFLEDFCREFDGGESSDQVYQLESCFFRLARLKRKTLGLMPLFGIISLVLNILLLTFFSTAVFASGSIAGNPADDNTKNKPMAWFLGEQKIKWCVQFGEPAKLYVNPERSLQLIRTAFTYWRNYLNIKKVHQDWYTEVPKVSLNEEYQGPCQGNEDLRFLIGTEDDKVKQLKAQYQNPWGFAELLEYDEKVGWGKGLIWLKEKDSQNKSYDSEFEYTSLLLHEMGHMLGCGHVEGTIMSADLINTLNFIGQYPVPPSYHYEANVDLQKELYFSFQRGLHALSYVYTQPNQGQKDLVKMLLGIDLNSALHMGFIQGEEKDLGNARLYMAYEGQIPLDRPHTFRGLEIKERGGYTQKTKLEGRVFKVVLDLDTIMSFNTSDSPIFRVRYQEKEYYMHVPGYLVQGRILRENAAPIPIVYGRNKGEGEYVRISALLENKQVPFFEANLTTQPYW